MIHCCYCNRRPSWRRLPGALKRFAYICRECMCIYDSRTGQWVGWDEFAVTPECVAAQIEGGDPC